MRAFAPFLSATIFGSTLLLADLLRHEPRLAYLQNVPFFVLFALSLVLSLAFRRKLDRMAREAALILAVMSGLSCAIIMLTPPPA